MVRSGCAGAFLFQQIDLELRKVFLVENSPQGAISFELEKNENRYEKNKEADGGQNGERQVVKLNKGGYDISSNATCGNARVGNSVQKRSYCYYGGGFLAGRENSDDDKDHAKVVETAVDERESERLRKGVGGCNQ